MLYTLRSKQIERRHIDKYGTYSCRWMTSFNKGRWSLVLLPSNMW